MDEEILNKYRLAGKISAEAKSFGKKLIKPGASLLDIANRVESKIIDGGAGLAFPVNISINEIAAHYSPTIDDKLKIKKGDVVKLDLGAHIDGYIADTAITVEVAENKYTDMIKASSEALDAVIDFIKPGVNLFDIGKIVSEKINSYGFIPIENLTGHSLRKYTLHAGISVPSVPNNYRNKIPKEGEVLAIEPFATNGAGHVIQGDGSNIYLCKGSFSPRLVRNRNIKILFNKMKQKFKTLPFSQRNFISEFPNTDVSLRKLCFLGLIQHYPQLIEADNGIVTQKEHTVILTDDGCEVTT